MSVTPCIRLNTHTLHYCWSRTNFQILKECGKCRYMWHFLYNISPLSNQSTPIHRTDFALHCLQPKVNSEKNLWKMFVLHNQQWMSNQGCCAAHRFHCLICKARNERLLWIPKRRHSRQAKMKNPIYCKSRKFAIRAFVQRQESLSTRRRRKKKWEGKNTSRVLWKARETRSPGFTPARRSWAAAFSIAPWNSRYVRCGPPDTIKARFSPCCSAAWSSKAVKVKAAIFALTQPGSTRHRLQHFTSIHVLRLSVCVSLCLISSPEKENQCVPDELSKTWKSTPSL